MHNLQEIVDQRRAYKNLNLIYAPKKEKEFDYMLFFSFSLTRLSDQCQNREELSLECRTLERARIEGKSIGA